MKLRTTILFGSLILTTLSCEDKPAAGGATANSAAPSASTAGLPPVPDEAPEVSFKAVAETVGDHQVLRYKVPGFDTLAPKQKELAYYLYKAAISGRDITYDQNFAFNLLVRRSMEAVLQSYAAKDSDEYKAALVYTKQVWLNNGIHHDYSSAKIEPGFDKDALAKLIQGADAKLLPLDPWPGSEDKLTPETLTEKLTTILFDEKQYATRVSRKAGADVVKASANNFYGEVSQKEVEGFYKKLKDPKDTRPISHGLNSKLVKEDGKLVEKVWKVGGMYSPAI
ncbi:MAG TPA: hypothetical protein PKA88_21135, partial [Polyangiaceae bacterium]|nr:hypothetical protein [Polyangiaceae bacterium]